MINMMNPDSIFDVETAYEAIKEVTTRTATSDIKKLASAIESIVEEYRNVDNPLYQDTKYLVGLEGGTRKEILDLVKQIKKGLKGLIQYIRWMNS
jgi:hypothetical protein